MDNPRHPHRCVIYRMVGGTAFADGKRKVIYDGVCRKESSTTMRTFMRENVIKSDFRLSIPGQVIGLRTGDFVDVTDLCGTLERCILSNVYVGNLGTSAWFNVPNN